MTTSGDSHQIVAHGLRGIVAADFEAGARALGLDQPDSFDRAIRESIRTKGGRGDNFLLSSGLWPGRVRLRPLRHGGLLGAWSGDRYFFARRSEREFQVWQTLEARGAPLPAVVLATSRRRGLFWIPTLGAVNLEEATDGRVWLQTRNPSKSSIRKAATAIARSLRLFHDVGAIHGDLHIENILLEHGADSIRCWLIDLARTRLRRSPSARERMRDMMRLVRSLEKTHHHDALDPRTRARFLATYCCGDRELRRRLLEWAGPEERRLHRHRLGWCLRGLAVALASISLSGCSPGIQDAEAKPRSSARLSLLATGDTGRNRSFPSLFEGQLAVAHAMTEEDRQNPVDGLILLGDNFYWHGLDREHLTQRILKNLVVPYCHFLELGGTRSKEVASGCSIPANARHPTPFYAVLGNHDLELPESVELQRGEIDDFLPLWHMAQSLAEVFELGHGVSLILFESEPSIDDETKLGSALVDAIRHARGPWRIIATHRPIATDDLGGVALGGYPAFVRKAIVSSGARVQLVLAGHHHNLQAFALDDPTPLLQIVAGSGSRAAPPLAKDPPGSLFGSIQLGFARIDLVGDGAHERLSVRLFGTARWPILARLHGHAQLAYFEVDRSGAVSVLEPEAP